MREFTTFSEFRAAVLAAGHRLYTDPPFWTEGMDEEDPFQPTYAVLHDNGSGVLGHWDPGNEHIDGSGVLYESPDAYSDAMHRDQMDSEEHLHALGTQPPEPLIGPEPEDDEPAGAEEERYAEEQRDAYGQTPQDIYDDGNPALDAPWWDAR